MRTALQFSGGKDSLALLLHMRALWPHITVLHVDSGDLPDEGRRIVSEVSAMVPNFRSIQSDSIGFRKQYGDPTGDNWAMCCNANIWMPMNNAVREMGFRQLLRGSKACDPHIHAVFPGDIHEGVLYTFPLWHWSDKMVDDYLGEYLHTAYRMGAHGMPDCATCTAEEACGMKTRHLWKEAA